MLKKIAAPKNKQKGVKQMSKEDWQVRNVLSVECVAAYVRVSTQEQKLHGLSLDAQKMKLTEYAEKNNMKIVEWYIDEGVSGRKLIKNRPELQRMIQDAEKGKFERIIFIKLDRFFRSVAEYHECMKRISPVIWSTTEEEYDLTTANGRMLVNMKLTIAEMEADQPGERIRIVNEYKVSTGQPLVGKQSLPFGWTVGKDEKTGRKNVIRDPEEEPILRELLDYYMTYQSKRKALVMLHTKYHISMTPASLSALLSNTMLYGAYRDNPEYCEAYIDKDTFDKLQDIARRNIKENTADNRAYLFSGLIKCPECGRLLKSYIHYQKLANGATRYKKYRCAACYANGSCTFNKAISENVFERKMLANITNLLADAKYRATKVSKSDEVRIPKQNIDEIHTQIERLNYSWQTGKIRTVEKYESDYADLMEQLERAEAELGEVETQDFSKVEAVLQLGWRSVYRNLDDEHKRAFWRSFISSIEIEWTTEKKEIKRVNFF